MAPTATHRWLTIALLAGCSAFGAYATLGAGFQNGLFAALTKAISGPKNKHFPGGPKPFKTTYTGIPALDDYLLNLIAFFTVILDGPRTEDAAWVSRYLTMQFLAGWALLSLEGLRKGNQGRAVSWTGTLGFIFQNITYTVSVPIYLIMHLLTSPVSDINPSPAALGFETQDLYLLPPNIIAAFVAPTVKMMLPVPSMATAAAHYSWQAIWQIFPVTQSVFHNIMKRLTAPISFKPDFHDQLDEIYRAVALVSFGPQTTLLALAATPAHLVPEVVLKYVPGLTREIFKQLDVMNVFVPYMPWNSPVVAAISSKVVPVNGLPELVKLFLQWDIYMGGTAILIWSAFVYSAAKPEKAFLSSTLPKIAFYTVFGGPVGAATMLLWERDASAKQQVAQPKPISGSTSK